MENHPPPPSAWTSPLVLRGEGHACLLTPSGTGFSASGPTLLTAWSGDVVEDSEGLFLYLRDLEGTPLWSATPRPRPRSGGPTTARLRGATAEFEREEWGVGTRLSVFVTPEGEEVRLLRVRNHSQRPRQIEVTSYAEVALNTWAAHNAHPVFSRLFLQTEFDPSTASLLVRRRPRAQGESHPWLLHTLVGAAVHGHESDRSRFLGRGTFPGRPSALLPGGRLGGNTGNVLDPCVSLQARLHLAPGEERSLAFVLAAAGDRDHALERAVLVGTAGWVDAAHDTASRHPGIPPVPPREIHASEALTQALTAYADAIAFSIDGSPPASPPCAPAPPSPGGGAPPETLVHFNGIGGFSADGRDYVLRLRAAEHGLALPPLPWVNVMANDTFGCLVSETGAGPTWSGNSREHRLTPWFNDPVRDPHGEALYLVDEETGAVWSPLPGPRPAGADYEVRHRWGATLTRVHSGDLKAETTVFVPVEDPVKVSLVRLENTTTRPRRLVCLAYAQLVMGHHPAETRPPTTFREEPGLLFATRSDLAEGRAAFSSLVGVEGREISFSTDRARVLGIGGIELPDAARRGALDGDTGPTTRPCFAWRVELEIPPGASVEFGILLGETRNPDAARDLGRRLATPGACREALRAVEEHWRERLQVLTVSTPSPELDLMLNGWLQYQNLSCRIRGRTALYQSGGAFGFRDQLQDSSALAQTLPHLTRAQILLHAGHQFAEGDVLHWWHPPDDWGIRTRFADDLLWLPWITAHYLNVTGDLGLLDEDVHYLTARALEPGEDEAYLRAGQSADHGTLYDHCCRAIDRSLITGAHGLPLFGTGDWNDGMNRVGRLGVGESVWMGFFLVRVIRDFAPLCRVRGDLDRRERYLAHADALTEAINTRAWDGEWYRRGTYDNGDLLGSRSSDECRIDALAQAWSVISGVAPPDRMEQALDAVERELISDRDALIRLLSPPFDTPRSDPGYIMGYVPGVRENGGQYTHAALWVVRAFAEAGRTERAAELLAMLNPVNHARTPDAVDLYRVEPYVIAADVYGAPPHVGRGGWTWYTGSAGWMLRVAVESVLGLTLEGGRSIRIAPRIPPSWPGYTAEYRPPGSTSRYRIEVVHDGGPAVIAAQLDGRPLSVDARGAHVPLDDGPAHRDVRVVLGARP